jgi:hypothetical protein
MPSAPIESKVVAASGATAVSAALTGVALWALETYVFHGELPAPVWMAAQTVIPAGCSFVAGFLARHTPRPDLRLDPVDREAADRLLNTMTWEPVRFEGDLDDEPGRHTLDHDPHDIPVHDFNLPHRLHRPE